jgi:hypothetical protein
MISIRCMELPLDRDLAMPAGKPEEFANYPYWLRMIGDC